MAKPRSRKQASNAPAADQKAAGADGAEPSTLDARLIRQVLNVLWFPEGISEEQQVERARSAVSMLRGIKPADELEGMLATQMVGTHSAAMECLRRAMIQNQSFEGRDQNLKHAAKLLAIYARQMDALNKHRGKGQQKVTVEHVHVEAGGQAMVGHIETGQPRAAAQPFSPEPYEAIPHAPGEMLDLTPLSRTKQPARRREE